MNDWVAEVELNEAEDDKYDYGDDYCYECRGYGDDYFINDDGDLESYCPYCTMNPYATDGGDE